MAEIRVQVPDEVLSRLKERLRLRTNTDVIEEALTMLSWAAEERDRGRLILSSDVKGGDVTRLAMKSLLTPLS
jgi:hypothetical protein